MDGHHEIFYCISAMIATETLYRIYHCNPFQSTVYLPCAIFFVAYLLVILVALLDLKHVKLLQSEHVRNIITVLHLLDGPIIVVLGLALYYERMDFLLLSTVANTKLFLLSFITRMVTGFPISTRFESFSATSRSFFHHLGSFLFVSHPETILVTTGWRFFSMCGHALLAWKSKEYTEIREQFVMMFSCIRQLTMVIVLFICYAYPAIRRGFGLSGVGHAAYLLVRVAVIFRAGKTFISGNDRPKFQSLSDIDRFIAIITLRYPWLAFELAIHSFTALFFLYLRLTTQGVWTETCALV